MLHFTMIVKDSKMETKPFEPSVPSEPIGRRSWHKPMVERLVITLDTQHGGNSPVDGAALADTGPEDAYTG